MNDQQISPEAITAFLKANNGIRYMRCKLALRLCCASADLVAPLHALEESGQIKSAVDGKNRMYWVPTQQERDAENNRRAMPAWKPLVGYGEMMIAAMNRRG